MHVHTPEERVLEDAPSETEMTMELESVVGCLDVPPPAPDDPTLEVPPPELAPDELPPPLPTPTFWPTLAQVAARTRRRAEDVRSEPVAATEPARATRLASVAEPARSAPPGPVRAARPWSWNERPRYPAALVGTQVEGTVVLRISVDEGGRVTSVEVLESSGHPALDEEALRVVRRWRFDPGWREGHAVATTLRQRVRFRVP